MLRITQQTSSEGAKKYYSQSDYLSEGQELVGSWGGKAAKMLGLDGTVDKLSFDRLCDNLDPSDGTQLTARTRSDRTVGYDFTFSVPKSVSLRYAKTGDERIFDAFRESVEETMREDAEPLMKTRVRKGRKNEERTTGNMIHASFYHKTARPVDGVPDPHLHGHVFVFNATCDDKERRFKAGQFRDVKSAGPMLQAMFRVRLANKLQNLGIPIERKRDDFEIAGFTPAMLKRFSRRTEHIEKVAKEKGITDPERKAELGQKTREAKDYKLSWDELLKEWDSRLTDTERKAVTAVFGPDHMHYRQYSQQKTAVDYALEHCESREATMTERKVLTEALKRGLGSVTIDDVKRELARRPLIRAVVNGVATVATPEMERADMAVVRFGREGRGRYRPFVEQARTVKREWLNPGQKAAVLHVIGSRDRVTLVRGPAGTGKTTLEQEIGDAFREAGVPLVAIAQSTSAVDVLRTEANFADADTLARFLRDKKMQAAAVGGAVLVDEGSQIGTKDMLALFTLCEQLGARVILVGDTRQTRAVAAGEPMRLLEKRAGLKVATVSEIVRQKGEYAKAAKDLSESKTAEGFARLDGLGWIKEVPDSERYQAMAAAYLVTIAEKKRNGEYKTALAVSPTWAEASRITQAIRDQLKLMDKPAKKKPAKLKPGEEKSPEKMLGEERTLDIWVPAHLTDPQKADNAGWIEPGDLLKFHQNVAGGYKNGSRVIVTEGMKLPVESAEHFEVYRPAKLAVAVGDRIRYTANGFTKDGKHALRNGWLTTVKGFTASGDIIENEHGWVISKNWGHIAHGYAVSAENSQGRTVDKTFIGISSQSFGAANERRAYVAWTRGREEALLFTDDKKELLKAVQKPDQPLAAIELAEIARRQTPLRQRLKRHLMFARRLATFAHLHREHGPETRKVTPLQQERVYALRS